MVMARVGVIGWRGMVGSVLVDRMRAEGDFALITPEFFSTSKAGGLEVFRGIGAGSPCRCGPPARSS